MAVINFDVDDYLAEASVEALKREVDHRIATGKWRNTTVLGDPEPWTPGGLADDLRKSFYARDASRMEMLLRVLDPHDRPALRLVG